MPRAGAAARAEQIATLEKLAHGRFVSEEVGAWLEGAAAETRALGYESDDASLVRLTRRDYEKACRIPPALVEELARQTSLGMEVWVEARAQSDFGLFRGALQTLVDLQRELADCLGYRERRYDALLDQYEPGMQSADLDRLFADLKRGLVPLVQDISQKLDSVQDEVLRRRFPIDKQTAFGLELAQEMGFDLSAGRQDESVHPFCTSFSSRDVRITTRFDEKFLPSALFGTLHETGHALYEQGVSPALERTPLSGGTSLGIHESQSRMWENLVGRSRGFWKFAYPRLQRAFPRQLAGCSLEAFYRAINRVEPSLIRVEADEVTYNLHIMLRYELEAQLVDDRLPVADLPEAWNGKMRDYLGITPPNDALGVLPGRPLVSRPVRVLPHLFPGKSDFGAAFRTRPMGDSQHPGGYRTRGILASAGLVEGARPLPRPEVHARRTGPAGNGRGAESRALRELPEGQVREIYN